MANQTHGGNINYFSKKYKIPERKIIDFSANINPFGLSPITKKAIQKSVKSVIHYPDPKAESLRKSLAEFHNIDIKNLLIGNGSIELIYLLSQALKPQKTLIPVPAFSEYELAAKINGSKIFFTSLSEKEDFSIKKNEIMKLIPKVDLVFISNPNSPTGKLFSPEDILALIKKGIDYKTIVVIDEVFIDFVINFERFTMIHRAIRNKYLLVLRSLTKFFAIPGLRLGYIVGHKSLINKIGLFSYPWNINSLAQVAGRAALSDYNYMSESRKFIENERVFLFNKLINIDSIHAYPSSTNFILCKIIKKKSDELPRSKLRGINFLKKQNTASCGELTSRPAKGGINAKKLTEYLGKKGIMIRDCSNFRGLNDKFFRVAVKKRRENLKLVSRLKEILL
jgi:threonine-phosphate decarboxylase